MDRRSFLSTSVLAAGASMLVGTAEAAPAPQPTTKPIEPSRIERLKSAIPNSRMPLDFDGKAF